MFLLSACVQGPPPMVDTIGPAHAVPVPVVAPPEPEPSAPNPTSPADAAPTPTSPADATPTPDADPQSTNPPCSEVPPVTTAPAGASQEAVAYMAAVAAGTPAWLAIDATLTAEGDDLLPSSADLSAEYKVDAAFTTALENIEWSAEVEPAASDLIYSLLDYLTFLNEYLGKGGLDQRYPDRDSTLLSARGAASANLRVALHLPPANCTLERV